MMVCVNTACTRSFLKLYHMNFITSFVGAGISRGELQKQQAELAQLAAMAALMCASAGWWMAEVPMTQLSQQAAAGVRPDLIELSQV